MFRFRGRSEEVLSGRLEDRLRPDGFRVGKFQAAYKFGVQLVPRPAGFDVTAQIATGQRQVPDAIQDLVAGAFVRGAEPVINDSLRPENEQVARRRPLSVSLGAQRL